MNRKVAGKAEGGRLAENIVHFARALRRAGLPVGPAAVVDAIRAVEVAASPLATTSTGRSTPSSSSGATSMLVFDEAFRLFWRSRQFLEKMLSMFLQQAVKPPEEKPRAAATRVAEALYAEQPPQERQEPEGNRYRRAPHGLIGGAIATPRLCPDVSERDRRGRAAD